MIAVHNDHTWETRSHSSLIHSQTLDACRSLQGFIYQHRHCIGHGQHSLRQSCSSPGSWLAQLLSLRSFSATPPTTTSAFQGPVTAAMLDNCGHLQTGCMRQNIHMVHVGQHIDLKAWVSRLAAQPQPKLITVLCHYAIGYLRWVQKVAWVG